MTLAPLGVAALALLHERPLHPYEMYQLILDRHEDRVLRISAGTLYRTVERLNRDGYAAVVSTAREGNRPERTTYEITPEGRVALVERVREILREPVQDLPAFVIGLAEARNLDRSEVSADLAEHLTRLDGVIADLEGLIDQAREGAVLEIHYLETIYLRDMALAQGAWLHDLITRLDEGDIPWPGPTP